MENANGGEVGSPRTLAIESIFSPDTSLPSDVHPRSERSSWHEMLRSRRDRPAQPGKIRRFSTPGFRSRDPFRIRAKRAFSKSPPNHRHLKVFISGEPIPNGIPPTVAGD